MPETIRTLSELTRDQARAIQTLRSALENIPNTNDENVIDLIVTALEGGSNYWYTDARAKEPIDDRYKLPADNWTRFYLPLADPLNAILIDAPEIKATRLHITLSQMRLGIARASVMNPPHFARVLAEGGAADAETADVILQLALLGEVVFG